MVVDINRVSLRKKSIVGKSLCCMQSWGGGGSYDVYSLLWEWCVSWSIDIAYRDFTGCFCSSYFPTFPLALLITPQHHFSSLLISATPFLSFYHPSLLLFLQNSFQHLSFLDKPSWLERKVQTDLSANYLRILVKGDLLLSLPQFECTPVPS